MTENTENKSKTLGLKKTLSLKTPLETSSGGRRSSVGGRNNSVAVEVKKKRGSVAVKAKDSSSSDEHLTDNEKEARLKALQESQKNSDDKKDELTYQTKVVVKSNPAEEAAKQIKEDKKAEILSKEELRQKELEELEKINTKSKEENARKKKEVEEKAEKDSEGINAPAADKAKPKKFATRSTSTRDTPSEEAFDDEKGKKKAIVKDSDDRRWNKTKLTVYKALSDEDGSESEGRGRSMAAQRRAREKRKLQQQQQTTEHIKQYREVTLPEVITVQELSHRMTERVGDVVKKLMSMGIMATANQSIDADTAELIVLEFGHTVKRVKDSDVELGTHSVEDREEDLQHRPPVVTIMGHVDHGKTSLLDTIRKTQVVQGEAGGITQHIGAYQIKTEAGKRITFIDTPGHAAFTEMRARGADVTDIVVLIVAANDSVMPQTVEAISHSKAASKPIIVAINKCDLPDANPMKVKQELLNYEIVVEEMGGDVQCVEVSAKTGMNLHLLEEAILVQAEILELKANYNRTAIGSVIESRQEHGRGAVATVLVQKGTLKVSDIFVTGTETGRVRALLNDRGEKIQEAYPGQPVEVLGITGTPQAGDDFTVVETDAKAREIAEFRLNKKRAMSAVKVKATGLEQMMTNIKAGQIKNLPILIKGDVHGSIEAIAGSLNKITEENTEVKVQILHSGVGAISESDITLAKASNAFIIGFNVRANAQAKDLAKQENVEIRYYSIIYEVIDEVKALLSGMLSPDIKEDFIGYAQIRQIFNMSKYGKVAGCIVTEGHIKRGSKVRLLRDNVVIHEGTLKTLRRFKDEVKEVQKGLECGVAFENYEDIKEGDVVEAFEIIETERKIE